MKLTPQLEMPNPRDLPRFCAVPDRASAAGTVCRWDNSLWQGPSKGWDGQVPRELMIAWHFKTENFPHDANTVNAAIQQSLDQYPEICALRFTRTDNPKDAHILMDAGKIDGPGGVLAWSELSCGPDRQLNQMYGSKEKWWFQSGRAVQNLIHFQATVWHEVAHANGLDHGGDGLMSPFMQADVWQPQPGYDIDEHQYRYGPPVTSSPPPNEPDGEQVIINLTLAGKRFIGTVKEVAA